MCGYWDRAHLIHPLSLEVASLPVAILVNVKETQKHRFGFWPIAASIYNASQPAGTKAVASSRKLSPFVASFFPLCVSLDFSHHFT